MKKSRLVLSILSSLAAFALLMPQSGRADCPTFTVGPSNLSDAVVGMSYLQPVTSRTWTTTGSLNDARWVPNANVLNDGRVFVCSGFFASWDEAKCEIYNPTTGQWTETQQMVEGDTGRGGYFSATVLQNGKVLVFGGDGSFGTGFATEIYDPQSDTWETNATPAAAVRFAHTATLLHSGKVLVTGGLDSTDVWVKNAWLFDPATAAWTQTGSMHSARASHRATVLLNGKVLITDDTGTAELYDPATGIFSVTDAPAESSGKCVTLLPNGNVLACTGANDGTDAEIYDLATKTWRPTGSLHYSRWNATATLLRSGEVMVGGGTDELKISRSQRVRFMIRRLNRGL
ncbi:MAG: Branched-chain amino acid transporter, amino acid-binding protein [Verrucomicrobiales bacterium]|nr:Branched-chain amino acid transporter, amino acid-binding protein [Verrucomicrobiales bacterium]